MTTHPTSSPEMVEAAILEFIRWCTGFDSKAPKNFAHSVFREDGSALDLISAHRTKEEAQSVMECERMKAALDAALRLVPPDAEHAALVTELRNARMMVNYGHGDVRDEPDPLHERAADAIEAMSHNSAIERVASSTIDAPDQDGLDGTARLCLALYGRKAAARDYCGGSDARMLHDAADRLADQPQIGQARVAAEPAQPKAGGLAVEVLRSIEWINIRVFRDNYVKMCPACEQTKEDGHTPTCDLARALSGAETGRVEVPFQSRVDKWLIACFGETIARDRMERNHRFIEEALELVQANGCTKSEAHQLVDYVYSRPVGDLHQEVGGVMNTLAALCLASGVDLDEAAETELARVWTKVEKIRAKQAAKPKHSPLPEAAAESALTAAEARIGVLEAALKPFAQADRAIGKEPGPFRFETGTGHRLIERDDLARAGTALSVPEKEGTATPPSEPGSRP